MKTNKVILVVDDDADDRALFAEALYEMDDSAVFFTATNGEEALHLLEHENVKPDVIFLDLNMPRIDGKQLLSLLRRDARFRHIPVIVLTTSHLSKDKIEVAQLGATQYITKASSMSALQNSIEHALSTV